GTVTSVVSGTGLVAGTITNGGTVNVDVGTAANKILQLTVNTQIPAVDGYLISVTPATNAQTLFFNATTSQWVPGSVNGDATINNLGALTVGKIQGYAVSATGPTANQVLTWNGTTAQWQALAPATSGTVTSVVSGTGLVAGTITNGGTVNVDVGTAANKVLQLTVNTQIPAVDGYLITNSDAQNIRGNLISVTPATNAQTLFFNATTSQWVPGSVNGDATINNLGALTVGKIQGYAVSATGPTANQVLTWNGTTAQWQALAPATSGTVTSVVSGTGLVAGTITNGGTVNVDV